MVAGGGDGEIMSSKSSCGPSQEAEVADDEAESRYSASVGAEAGKDAREAERQRRSVVISRALHYV